MYIHPNKRRQRKYKNTNTLPKTCVQGLVKLVFTGHSQVSYTYRIYSHIRRVFKERFSWQNWGVALYADNKIAKVKNREEFKPINYCMLIRKCGVAGWGVCVCVWGGIGVKTSSYFRVSRCQMFLSPFLLTPMSGLY